MSKVNAKLRREAILHKCHDLPEQYMSKDEQTPTYDMSIHSNPSALAWTKFFRECRPECNLDDETMLGWFANAMMAMHDHIYQTAPPKREPLSDDVMMNRAMVHNYHAPSAYCRGFRDAEKAHGIGGE